MKIYRQISATPGDFEVIDLDDIYLGKNPDKINFPDQNKVHLQENGTPLLSTFSYGLNANNVTPEGKNVFVGNAGNDTMGLTAYSSSYSSYNTAMGYNAFYSNTTGAYNTAIGYDALRSNTTGLSNTALGNSALYANTGGINNTAIGYDAFYSNTTGSNNTAIGYNALYSNTTGYFNTALGYNAGRYIANGVTAKTTGDNSVFFGYNSKASANGVNNETVIGYAAIGKGANTVVLGNSLVTKAYVGNSELAKKSEIPNSIKNPYSLTIKQDGVTLDTYDGSSAKEINIIKQWIHLGTIPHSQGTASFYPSLGDFSEYMVIYTNSSYGKYSNMTEVVYGPVDLVNGMSLPGYVESGISCTSSGILIEWNSGGSADAKTYVIVYAK